jgi:phosphopantetheinyl transferase (holo-ACP synthase)
VRLKGWAMNSFSPRASSVRGGSWPHVGVDVVSIARIEKAGDLAVRRLVCGARELAALDRHLRHRSAPDRLLVTAATWALKEAAVKAAGGRPAAFRWPMISVAHGCQEPGELTAFLGDAVCQVTGDKARGWCRFEWQASGPSAHGVGTWGTADGAVWAVVLEMVMEQDDGTKGRCR